MRLRDFTTTKNTLPPVNTLVLGYYGNHQETDGDVFTVVSLTATGSWRAGWLDGIKPPKAWHFLPGGIRFNHVETKNIPDMDAEV